MADTPYTPVKPRLTTITYHGIEYHAVVEGTMLSAFPSKAEAETHYAEVLDDYHESLLESYTGTRQ